MAGRGWSSRCCTGSGATSRRSSSARGQPVRVYIPYGTEWYPYLTRRLAERPANIWFFVVALLRLSGGHAMTQRDERVAFLGGGKMGEALVSGLIRSGGRTADEIMVTCRREERARELGRASYGIAATLDNPRPSGGPTTLVLMVKPQDMEALLEPDRRHVTPEHLVIIFAAGIRTSFIEKHLPDGVPVVRVMSNVPVLVDEAMSVISAGLARRGQASRRRRGAARLRSGRVLRLTEKHQDAVTATSGSGPAYFFLLAEAMIEACILLGLSRDVATELIIQTMLGSAKMLRDTGQAPGRAPRDGHFARRDDDRGDPPSGAGRGAGGVPERDRRGPQAKRGARAGRRRGRRLERRPTWDVEISRRCATRRTVSAR